MYAGRNAEVECLVDEEDYRYFTQWLWEPLRHRGKIYFKRTRTVRNAGERVSEAVYLHVEILTRAEGSFPTRDRNIADHWNGNSLDNRRDNLRWLTKRQNNRNRFGCDYYQRALTV